MTLSRTHTSRIRNQIIPSLIHYLKCLVKKSGRNQLKWAIAHTATRFIPRKLFFQVTGVMPIECAMEAEYTVIPFELSTTKPLINLNPPTSIYGLEEWNTIKLQVAPVTQFISIEDGIASSSGHVFSDNCQLIHLASHRVRAKPKSGWVYRPWRPFIPIPHQQGRVAIFTASDHSNYYHWLFDILPRIRMMIDSNIPYDWIYLQQAHRFQRETLAAIGIDMHRVIDCDTVPILQADCLVIPCHQITVNQEIPLDTCKILQNWFLNLAGPSRHGKRLYVMRSGAHHRRLKNEKEVIALLNRYGFECHQLEIMPFLKQVSLLHNADVIIAPHGAGLSNLVFCKPGSTVIEFFPPFILSLYYRLSTVSKLNYFFLKAPGKPHKSSGEDYSIDVKDIERTLKLANITK